MVDPNLAVEGIYFDDLLNPTNTHYEEEAELKDSGVGSLNTRVKVPGVVKQLCSNAQDVDENCPKLLKLWIWKRLMTVSLAVSCEGCSRSME